MGKSFYKIGISGMFSHKTFNADYVHLTCSKHTRSLWRRVSFRTYIFMKIVYEPVPKGAPSNTSICALAPILMVNCLFHCLAYLTEDTLKRNKSSYEQLVSALSPVNHKGFSYEQAEYQRTHQKDKHHFFFLHLGFRKVGYFGMISWYCLYWCWTCIIVFNFCITQKL